MCLSVSSVHYSAVFDKVTPFTAEDDIVVYKVLESPFHFNNEDDRYYISPYRGAKYKPGNGYFIWFELMATRDHYNIDRFHVHEGLHAFVDREAAYKRLTLCSGSSVYKMIIPKGAQYFLGKEYDIVTNRLVFPTKEEDLVLANFKNYL